MSLYSRDVTARLAGTWISGQVITSWALVGVDSGSIRTRGKLDPIPLEDIKEDGSNCTADTSVPQLLGRGRRRLFDEFSVRPSFTLLMRAKVIAEVF